MHYRQMTNLSAVISTMNTYEKWMVEREENGYEIKTSYEKLHQGKTLALAWLVLQLTGKVLDPPIAKLIWERQSVKKMKIDNTHTVRKGIVGDWNNHFTQVEGKQITDILGNLMIEQGYIDNKNWWKELPLTSKNHP